MSSSSLPSLFVLGDSISMQYGPYLERYVSSRLSYRRKSNTDGSAANGGDSRAVRGYLEAWVLSTVAADSASGEESSTENAGSMTASRESTTTGSGEAATGHTGPDLQGVAIPTEPVDYLLINCGLHDIKTDPESGRRQVHSERYRANLLAIVDAGQRIAGTVFWVRTTPVDEMIHNSRSHAFHRFTEDAATYNAIADQVMASRHVACVDLASFTMSLGMAEDVFCDHVHFTDTVRAAQAAYIAGFLQCAGDQRRG